MIRADIYKDSTGRYTGFRLRGHADFAEEGQDIVCAAVSALTLNAVNSVETFTEDAFTCDAGEDGGYLKFRFTGEISEESDLLIRSMVLGLENIRNDYGTQFIKIRYEEV